MPESRSSKEANSSRTHYCIILARGILVQTVESRFEKSSQRACTPTRVLLYTCSCRPHVLRNDVAGTDDDGAECVGARVSVGGPSESWCSPPGGLHVSGTRGLTVPRSRDPFKCPTTACRRPPGIAGIIILSRHKSRSLDILQFARVGSFKVISLPLEKGQSSRRIISINRLTPSSHSMIT